MEIDCKSFKESPRCKRVLVGDFSVLDGLKVSPKWYDYFGIFSPPLYLSITYYNAVRFNLKEQKK